MNTKEKESQKQREQHKGYLTRPFVASPDEGYWTEDSDRDDFVVKTDKKEEEEAYQRYVVADEDRIREIVRDEIADIFVRDGLGRTCAWRRAHDSREPFR